MPLCLSVSLKLIVASDAIWQHVWVNTDSGNGLLPDSTKPLPEPILTYQQ